MRERLKSLASLITSYDAQEIRPFVALEHLEGGTGRLLPHIELPKCKAPASGAAAVEIGDVLFGKLRPYLAKTWLADRPIFASTELLCLRPRLGIDGRWLAYVCASRPLVEWAVATSDGTKMPRTSWEKLSGYRLWVPPVDLQRTIADFLDTETARIDAVIEKKRRLIELLEERLRLVAHELVMCAGKKVPLRRMVRQVKTGTTPPADQIERLSGADIPWYSPGDVSDWLLLRPPMRALAKEAISGGWVPSFPAQSTIIVGIGTVGKVAHLDHAASGNQQMTCIVPGPFLAPRFLSWQLFSRSDELRTTAPYTTMLILNNDFLRSLTMVVPALNQQTQIIWELDREADRVRNIDASIQRQLILLKEHRQALITAALAGQLDAHGVAA